MYIILYRRPICYIHTKVRRRGHQCITVETQSFTDHCHKQLNGVLQCIQISNAGETRTEERFLTI